MNKNNLKENLKLFCDSLELDYIDLVRLSDCLDELKKETIVNETIWKPLIWYNPKNNTTYDFSKTHEIGYHSQSNVYSIKKIGNKKVLNSKEGQYGLYWTITRNGKKYNIGEFQLKCTLEYQNRKEYLKYMFEKGICGSYSEEEFEFWMERNGLDKEEIIER